MATRRNLQLSHRPRRFSGVSGFRATGEGSEIVPRKAKTESLVLNNSLGRNNSFAVIANGFSLTRL
jgi:hypothetical protein